MAARLVVMNQAKRGLYTGRHIHLGNDVSEDGGNKSRKTWKSNAYSKGIFSRALDHHLGINPTHGLPSIDKAGGVDECLLDIPDRSVPGAGEQFKSVITNFDQDRRKSARRSSSLSSHWKSSRSPILLEALSLGSQKLGIFGVRELKTLKVVLTEEIDGLGRAGQVVGVAPGYARNKLIPHHLALPALDKYVTLVNNQLKFARPHLLVEKEDVKSTETISEEEKFEEIEAALRRLDTGKVVLRRHVSSLSNLQQAVTKEDIVFEVKRQMGVDLAASNVMLPADLTILGEFEVLLRFPRDLMMPGGKDKLLLKVRIRRK